MLNEVPKIVEQLCKGESKNEGIGEELNETSKQLDSQVSFIDSDREEEEEKTGKRDMNYDLLQDPSDYSEEVEVTQKKKYKKT